MSTKELSKPFHYISFITLPKDDKDLMQTYKDEIERLERTINEKNKSIGNLKDAINNLSEKKEYIENLEYFRDKLLFECPKKQFKKITILQCISQIEQGLCKTTRCKARLKHLDKFLFKEF